MRTSKTFPNTKPAGKWLGRAAIGLGVAAVAALGVGVVYQLIATSSDATRYPAPGTLVEAGGYKLHLLVKPTTGSAKVDTPTVIIDAGLGIPSTYYTRLQDEIASFAQVVIYDRAGMGYSKDAPNGMPHDALSNAHALHTALAAAGVTPPYIVAGHSAGGMNMLVFANEYPDEVQGVVLIDSEHPDQFKRYTPDHANDANKTLLMARGMGLVSNFGVTRLVNAPQLLEATELNAQSRAVLQAQFSTPRFWKGAENEVAAWEQYTFPQARAVQSLGNKPLVVLSSEGTIKGVPEQLAMHQEFAQLSTNGVQRTLAGVNHGNIVIHGAAQVAQAVREVMQAAQNGSALAN